MPLRALSIGFASNDAISSRWVKFYERPLCHRRKINKWKKDSNAAHLSAWPSRSRPCTRACCPPSGSTRRPWPAASCTRCRRSSAGGRRSPAPSAPPAWVGCLAGTLRTWCRISWRERRRTVRSRLSPAHVRKYVQLVCSRLNTTRKGSELQFQYKVSVSFYTGPVSDLFEIAIATRDEHWYKLYVFECVF